MKTSEQILSCPEDWVDRYRAYMVKRKIPFRRRKIGGVVCFILSRKYRPHAWKL